MLISTSGLRSKPQLAYANIWLAPVWPKLRRSFGPPAGLRLFYLAQPSRRVPLAWLGLTLARTEAPWWSFYWSWNLMIKLILVAVCTHLVVISVLCPPHESRKDVELFSRMPGHWCWRTAPRPRRRRPTLAAASTRRRGRRRRPRPPNRCRPGNRRWCRRAS